MVGPYEQSGLKSFENVTQEMIEALIPQRFREMAEAAGESVAVEILHQEDGILEFCIVNSGETMGLSVTLHKEYNPANPEASVYVYDFEHSENIRGQHIVMEFYSKLEEMLRSMGFTYYFGKANEHNISYFTDKLGRQRIRELSPLEIAEITNQTSESALRFMTHKKLN